MPGNGTPNSAANRPFHCEECSNTYTRQEHLDRHVSGVHRASKEFVCAQCSKGFSRRDILRRHEQAHAKAGKTGELKGSKPMSKTVKVPKKKLIRKVKEEEELDDEDTEPPRKILRTTKRQLASKPISSAESSLGGAEGGGREGYGDDDDEDDEDEDDDEDGMMDDDADDYDPHHPDGRPSRTIIDRGIGPSRLPHNPSSDDWNRPGSSYSRVPSQSNHPYADQLQQQSFYHSPIEHGSQHPPTSVPTFRIASSSFGNSQYPRPQSPLGLSMNSHVSWDSSSQAPAKSSFDFLGLVASASYLSDNESPSHSVARHLPTVPDASVRLDLSDPILQNAPFYSHLPPHSSLHRLHDSAADTLLSLSAPRTPPRSSPELEDVARGSYMNKEVWPTVYRPSNLNASNGVDVNHDDGSPPMATQCVPRVTHTTRDRLVKTIRDLAIVNASIPPLELMHLFVEMFFERYQALFPMIHLPTFDPNEAPSYLLLAMASIGARYCYRRIETSVAYAKALLEIARQTLLIQEELDHSISLTLAWQQALIFILMSGFCSGDKRGLELTHSASAMPASACRRQGFLHSYLGLDPAVEATYNIEERWRRWRDREATLRLGYGGIFFEGMGCALWGIESSLLFLETADSPLPCRDLLWEAPTAAKWQALFSGTLPPRGTTTKEALGLVTDRTQHHTLTLQSLALDVFACATILTILNTISWSNHREHHLKSFLHIPLAPSAAASTVQLSVNQGFEFFADRVILPPEVQELLLDTTITQSAMALMLHLSAMTSKLPLRALQPLIRTATFDANIMHELEDWATEDSGRLARATIYHAAQLLALVKIGTFPQDSPLDPMCIFYAALTLLSYVRAVSTTGGISSSNNGHSSSRGIIQLDRLVDRTETKLLAWIATGVDIPLLEEIGSLEGGLEAELNILRVCREIIVKLKVWQVGVSLAGSLAAIEDGLRV